MKIVADTSPLIAFAILQKLELLPQIFDEVWLPTAVFQEATTPTNLTTEQLPNLPKIK
jgi:predicted nucleic acid-binding protein